MVERIRRRRRDLAMNLLLVVKISPMLRTLLAGSQYLLRFKEISFIQTKNRLVRMK